MSMDDLIPILERTALDALMAWAEAGYPLPGPVDRDVPTLAALE